MCILLEVQHNTSTLFYRQGNFRVKIMLKAVENLISLFYRNYDKLHQNLPLFTLTYRSTTHEVTGYTPNFIMMGQEVTLLLDIMLGLVLYDHYHRVPQYVQDLKARMETCFTDVRDQLKQCGELQRLYYNLSIHRNRFEPGTAVYLKEKTKKVGVSPKLAPKWKGPYLLVKQFSSSCKGMTSYKVTKLYHFDLLKECHSQELHAWIRRARRCIHPGVSIPGVAQE